MWYCMREDKTWDERSGQRLISGVNCDGMNSILEFEATKAAHVKMDGINFYQYIQSFSPTENITHRQAHEIALEFAARACPVRKSSSPPTAIPTMSIVTSSSTP